MHFQITELGPAYTTSEMAVHMWTSILIYIRMCIKLEGKTASKSARDVVHTSSFTTCQPLSQPGLQDPCYPWPCHVSEALAELTAPSLQNQGTRQQYRDSLHLFLIISCQPRSAPVHFFISLPLVCAVFSREMLISEMSEGIW